MAVFHVFMLVWGERFVRDYVEVALPMQLVDGNLPTIADQGKVHYHIYTDRPSLGAFKPEIQELKKFVNLEFHLIDEFEVGGLKLFDRVRNLSGPQVKHEIQHHCLLKLAELALVDKGSVIILLDSNLLLSNGTLAAASNRIREGANAVNVNVLRVETERVLPFLKNNLTWNARILVQLGLDHLHHMQKAFSIDAKPFTAYPSQLNWHVGEEGILARAFIPHPLLIRVTEKMLTRQSAMDYDLALRCWPDHEIYMCGDSDEMLVLKHSEVAHQAQRDSQILPSARDLAMFLITATHKRHRIFGDVSIFYHANDINNIWEKPIKEAEELLTDVYQGVNRIIAQSENLDAKFLMLLKSHIGPIENYMSPGLEPVALKKL